MVSFYANTCLGLYKEGYLACQALKSAVIDLMIIVSGTIHPHDTEVRRRGSRVALKRPRCQSNDRSNELSMRSNEPPDESQNTPPSPRYVFGPAA